MTIFCFDPLREQDLPMLHKWLRRPHVVEWWEAPPTIDELRDEFLASSGAGPNATRAYVVSAGPEPLGFIQSYVVMGAGNGWWEGETDPGARGIDQFIADAGQLGRGVGTAMVRAFVQYLFSDLAVTVVQADPSPTNIRAIRCYARAGFREVGEIDTPDGRALLMKCARGRG
jgi:RimJ/RimL family protein N-acetyltransferase